MKFVLGVAVNVTALDALSVALHEPGHEIPAGDEATVPLPVPAVLTVTARVVVAAVTIVPALHVMAVLRWSVTGMALAPCGLLVGSLWAP